METSAKKHLNADRALRSMPIDRMTDAQFNRYQTACWDAALIETEAKRGLETGSAAELMKLKRKLSINTKPAGTQEKC